MGFRAQGFTVLLGFKGFRVSFGFRLFGYRLGFRVILLKVWGVGV